LEEENGRKWKKMEMEEEEEEGMEGKQASV
jgi:hypothetical protein